MCHCLQDSEQDAERSHQMAALRSLCLPRLTFLLLSVLQNSSRHQEALRLADIISSDQNCLYQVSVALLQLTRLLFSSFLFFFIFYLHWKPNKGIVNHAIRLSALFIDELFTTFII